MFATIFFCTCNSFLQIASTTLSPPSCFTTTDTWVNQTNHQLTFGKLFGDLDDNYAKGGIDELLIFEEILSAADVNTIYINYQTR